MTATVPAVEVADNANASRIRCPDRKLHATNAIELDANGRLVSDKHASVCLRQKDAVRIQAFGYQNHMDRNFRGYNRFYLSKPDGNEREDRLVLRLIYKEIGARNTLERLAHLRALLVSALALGPLGVCASTAQAPAAQEESGALEARVALVGSDLSVKPVPKQRFLLVPEAAGRERSTLSTDFEGRLATRLPAGRYRIQSESALSFEGRSYSWRVDFEIIAGKTTSLELSSDNATTRSAAAPDSPGEGAVYQKWKDGVFKVISDGGHGSGFLVSAEGLILTNHHVVADATYLAAKLDERHKHVLSVVEQDPEHDLDQRDKYGRLLAYIRLPDGAILNERIIAEGYGYAYLPFDHSRYDAFLNLQNQAIAARAGLWKNATRKDMPEWLQKKRPDLLRAEFKLTDLFPRAKQFHGALSF